MQGYFDTLAQENRDYWQGTPEEQERRRLAIENAKKREEARRAALTPEQRDAEDKQRVREALRAEKAAAKRKGPRPRRLPVGNGTDAGFRAGDQVKLRKEIN